MSHSMSEKIQPGIAFQSYPIQNFQGSKKTGGSLKKQKS